MTCPLRDESGVTLRSRPGSADLRYAAGAASAVPMRVKIPCTLVPAVVMTPTEKRLAAIARIGAVRVRVGRSKFRLSTFVTAQLNSSAAVTDSSGQRRQTRKTTAFQRGSTAERQLR